MRPKVMAFIAGVILLVALVFIWRQVNPLVPAVDHRPLISLGQVLADEAAHAVPDHGQIVIVLMGDAARPVMPVNGLWDGFNDELNKHAGIRIVAKEFTAPDVSGLPFCAPAIFQELLDRHTNADAFVFFSALPPYKMLSGSPNPGKTPKMIAMDLGQTFGRINYEGYFASGMLVALIGPRVKPTPASTAAPGTSRDYFNQHYQVYTPENYEALPD